MSGTKGSLKKILTFAIVVVFFVTGSTSLFLYLKGDRIKQLIITELNKHLTVEVSVNKIEISIFKSFPYVSIILKDAAMHPPKDFISAPGLVHAGSISLNFNLVNLISKRYIIHSVEIANAHISIYEDGLGHDNYSIWKKSSSTSDGSVDFNVKKMTLKSTKIFYRNTRRKDDIIISVKEFNIKGAFQNDQFTLKLKGNCLNEKLLIANSKIIPAGEAKIESIINVDTHKQTLLFRPSTLEISGVTVLFNGLYCYSLQPYTNLQITSISADLKDILTIIPVSISKKLSDYSTRGKLIMHGTISGPAKDLKSLKVTAFFNLNNSVVNSKIKNLTIEDIYAEGIFRYSGKLNSEILNINKISGKINSGRVKGSSVISNFNTPDVQFNFEINTDIADLSSFIENEFITDYFGQVTADIKYTGQFISGNRNDKLLSGQITFNDAGFTYNNKKITDLAGSLEFDKNNIHFNGVTCIIGSSDIKANGDIVNLVDYIFNDKKNINASLRIFSDKLILQDILDLAVTQGKIKSSNSIFPPNISFNALLTVNSLTYKKLSTKNITGTFTLKDDILRGSEISINALGGKITADGLINGRYGNKAQIITTAQFKGVDINRLFFEFGEFGQNSLVSDNIKGTANVNVDFTTSLYTDFTINSKSIEAIADVEIKNGELNNFEPLQALSKFLDASSLKSVRFATLSNRIEINHETVLIPQMEIQSSALNLAGFGTHTFGNDIDYHVNMLLSDVMKAKRNKHPVTEKYIEDDGYGKPRLFLKLTGPINDPLVQYDAKAVKNKIANDLKNEKQVFKDVIRKEFGGKRAVTESPDKVTPAKESTEFQIEWDENK